MTPSSVEILRMSLTTVRTHSWGAWLMLRRNMFAPAKIKARSLSGESVAGPSVQMIFVFVMAAGGRVRPVLCRESCVGVEGKQVLFRSLSPGDPEREEEDEKQQTTQSSSKGLIAA